MYYEAESCRLILFLAKRMVCIRLMVSLFGRSQNPSVFGRKPWIIIRLFDRNRGHYTQWKVLWSWNLRHSVPLELPFQMVSFLAEVKIFRFWPKTMDYNKAFWPKSRCFHHNSSLGGAMKLNFTPFCSSWDALSDGILVCRNRLHQFLTKNHGL